MINIKLGELLELVPADELVWIYVLVEGELVSSYVGEAGHFPPCFVDRNVIQVRSAVSLVRHADSALYIQLAKEL